MSDDDDVRAYVSDLWAEDWDSAEDALAWADLTFPAAAEVFGQTEYLE